MVCYFKNISWVELCLFQELCYLADLHNECAESLPSVSDKWPFKDHHLRYNFTDWMNSALEDLNSNWESIIPLVLPPNLWSINTNSKSSLETRWIIIVESVPRSWLSILPFQDIFWVLTLNGRAHSKEILTVAMWDLFPSLAVGNLPFQDLYHVYNSTDVKSLQRPEQFGFLFYLMFHISYSLSYKRLSYIGLEF